MQQMVMRCGHAMDDVLMVGWHACMIRLDPSCAIRVERAGWCGKLANRANGRLLLLSLVEVGCAFVLAGPATDAEGFVPARRAPRPATKRARQSRASRRCP